MAALATTLAFPASPSSKPAAIHQPLRLSDRSLVTSCHRPPPPPDDIPSTLAGISPYSVDPALPPPNSRRNILLSSASAAASSAIGALTLPSPALPDTSPPPDLTITHRAFLDIRICPTSFSTSRETAMPSAAVNPTLPSPPPSSSGFRCDDAVSLGRIVIGLYGKQVPQTVANFTAMCTGTAGSSYRACIIHRIIAGQYIVAGKQGSKEKGEVLPPSNLERNPETISPNSFKLRHSRPGIVSLCLSENDDEDQFKLKTGYRNVEFLITTGPGPAPQLDNKNIVFGTVLEGLDVVTAIAAVPAYKPSERIRQLNEFASFLGDERASNARNFWYRPLKAIYISDCGEL